MDTCVHAHTRTVSITVIIFGVSQFELKYLQNVTVRSTKKLGKLHDHFSVNSVNFPTNLLPQWHLN
jgi:hypothetical protein